MYSISKPILKLVLIEWEDSHHRPGWTSEAADAAPLVCHSVGWLVSETSKAKVLASNITNEEEMQRCGDMTIPQRCIRWMKPIGFDFKPGRPLVRVHSQKLMATAG